MSFSGHLCLWRDNVDGGSWELRACSLTPTMIVLSPHDPASGAAAEAQSMKINVQEWKLGQIDRSSNKIMLISKAQDSKPIWLAAQSSEEFLKWVHELQALLPRSNQQQLHQTLSCGMKFDYRKRVQHIFLVRHGHYINAHTVPRRPDNEKVLSQMGIEQAKRVGNYLASATECSRQENVEICFSRMNRAVETAHYMHGYFPGAVTKCDKLLIEGWPGRPFSETSDGIDDRRISEDTQFQENIRLNEAYEKYFSFPETANPDSDDGFRVIVCHANIIRYFICRVLGIDPVGVWGIFELNHCSITRIDVFEDGSKKILATNETGHLPANLRTSSEDHL